MYKLIFAMAVTAVAISPKLAFSQAKSAPTYSEQLRLEEERRLKEDEALKLNIAERDNRFGALPQNCPAAVTTAYTQRVEDFRKSMKEVRRHFSEFNMTPLNYDEDVKRIGQWDIVLADANKSAKAWIDEMVMLYASDPAQYNNIGLTLMEIVRREGQLDRVENVLEAAKTILDNPPGALDPPLIDAIGYIGYANCDYDLASKAWSKYSENAVLPEASNSKFRSLEVAKHEWEHEQEYRIKDKASDNPIVHLITSKGTLAVELFEDLAPNSVASFIYLIENNSYKNNRCFKVLEKIGIQTGCKIGDGSGDAGYRIAGEAFFPDARKVFRGSLFYAIGAPDEKGSLDTSTASTQFRNATTQLPALSGQVTVFGRVIDGDYKLGTFRKVDATKKEQKEDPNLRTDFLVKAEVIKKRNHEYVPEILAGKLPK